MKVNPKPLFSTLKQMRGDLPITIAHRGASAWANENTLRSFSTAHNMGAQIWELDVRLTKDGICVVCHDDNISRLTGLDLRISRSYWKDLRKIPLLRGGFLSDFGEVVNLSQELDSWLYVEIKGAGAGQAAWEELRNKGFKNAIMASFKEHFVRELYDKGCELPLSVLVPAGKNPFVMANSSKAEIIHLCWKKADPEPQNLVTPELLNQANESGLEVVLWDEERQEILEDLLKLPVLGICSDRPEKLVPFPKDGRPLIVCHRGAETFAPENTFSSVDLAFSQGLDIVEIDVRETLDGVPVVIHDKKVNRTTDGKGKIQDMEYDEVAKLDAGSWFDPFYSGERIPKLEEILIHAKGRGGVYIEIKDANPDTIINLVEKHGMFKDTFFWSKDLAIMDRLRELSSEVRLMSRRYDFDSLTAAIERHNPFVIEFEDQNFSRQEIMDCQKKSILSMPFYMGSSLKVLKKLSEAELDMINLGHPEIFKKMLTHANDYNSS